MAWSLHLSKQIIARHINRPFSKRHIPPRWSLLSRPSLVLLTPTVRNPAQARNASI